MIAIGNRREGFFDDFLVNEAASTAGAMLHKPIRRGVALAFDRPWEGNVCGYPNVFFAEGKWLLYYRAAPSFAGPFTICRAESTDGITWTRPSLGVS